jgi:hypothetical protein
MPEPGPNSAQPLTSNSSYGERAADPSRARLAARGTGRKMGVLRQETWRDHGFISENHDDRERGQALGFDKSDASLLEGPYWHRTVAPKLAVKADRARPAVFVQ